MSDENGYNIEKKPFVRYSDNVRDTLNLRLTDKDKELIRIIKPILQQDKESTAIKQAFELGAKVLLGESTTPLMINIIKDNIRRNKRIGIIEVE